MTAAATLPVRNPYTGETDYRLRPTDPAALPGIAAEMRAAQPGWAALGLDGRIALLQRFAESSKRHQAELIETLAADTGRWGISAMEADIPGKLARDIEPARAEEQSIRGAETGIPGLIADRHRDPYPLVGNISPWNFPLSLSLLDTFQPLLAGCAVLVKPSEITPRFIDVMERILAEVPELAAVFRFLRGGGDVGQALIESVDYICFTGSVPTGRKVYEAAARAFIPASLELGGKDPMLVLADADPEAAAIGAVLGGCLAAGQICTSLERIYVAAPIYDRFVEAAVETARKLKLNANGHRDGFIPPFIMQGQADIVARHIDDAVAGGARALTGGKIERHGGLWCPATVLTGVRQDMAVMQEETFGPVLPIMPFETEDEAVALANDSQYGLTGLVYGGDLDHARQVAARIRAGGIGVNKPNVAIMARGFEQDSYGYSGIGPARLGREGYLRFFRRKAVAAWSGALDTADSPLVKAAFA